jgi:hypothetical protein
MSRKERLVLFCFFNTPETGGRASLEEIFICLLRMEKMKRWLLAKKRTRDHSVATLPK